RGRQGGQRRLQGPRVRLGHVQKDHAGALAGESLGEGRADAGAAAGHHDQPILQGGVDRALRVAPSSRPRPARFRISSTTPVVQAGAWSQVATTFSSTPSFSDETRTRSPTLWVNPLPGAPRSSTGANMVPRYRAKPSGYWCALRVWATRSWGSRLISRIELSPVMTKPSVPSTSSRTVADRTSSIVKPSSN